MSSTTGQLTLHAGPSFRRPPVVETALGIQFSELRNFKAVHFGLLYEQLKDRFPVVQDHPRLEPIVEMFPPRPRLPAFRIGGAYGGPERAWYLTRDESRLVQVQPDRFGFNWRSGGEHHEYPRYSENGPKSLSEFRDFCEFCDAHRIGRVEPNLVEVVYVNHIRPQAGETAVECFDAVFSGIDWRHSDELLPTPETASLNRTYVIGESHGRLYAEASIVHDRDKSEFVLLKMTARVIYRGDGSVNDSLQLAHDWVVNGFVSLTDPVARRERWEQEP